MNELEILKMLNIILENIDIAERNQFSKESIKLLYDAKNALNNELTLLNK